MLRKIIPDVIRDQEPVHLRGGATVREAAKLMERRNLGSVLVMEAGRLDSDLRWINGAMRASA